MKEKFESGRKREREKEGKKIGTCEILRDGEEY